MKPTIKETLHKACKILMQQNAFWPDLVGTGIDEYGNVKAWSMDKDIIAFSPMGAIAKANDGWFHIEAYDFLRNYLGLTKPNAKPLMFHGYWTPTVNFWALNKSQEEVCIEILKAAAKAN